MNRWLYRAAGTVGLAGGFLLLGTGAAQADEAADTEQLDTLLGDVFSPTAGLPPLTTPSGGDETAAETITLRPDDGRLSDSRAEVLPLDGLLGGLPVDDVVGGLPLDGLVAVPLDGVGVPGAVGSGLPLDDLIGTDGLPLGLDGLTGSAVADPAPAQPADMPMGQPAEQPMGQPAEQPMGQPAGQVTDMPAPAASEVPAVIGEELTAAHGLAPELADERTEVVGELPLIGELLGPVGNLVGVGNLAGQLPVAGPLLGPVAGQLPVVSDGATRPTAPADPAESPGVGAAQERPVAGEDPMFAESTEVLPVGMLSQLPVTGMVAPMVDDLPVLGELGVFETLAGPVAMLRTLPVVGAVPGALPIS